MPSPGSDNEQSRPWAAKCGGAEGIRTPDLLIANETRYQLRHSPMRPSSARKKLPPAARRTRIGARPRRAAQAPAALR